MFLIYLVYGNCKCQRKEKKVPSLKGRGFTERLGLIILEIFIYQKDIFYDKFSVEHELISIFEFIFQSMYVIREFIFESMYVIRNRLIRLLF